MPSFRWSRVLIVLAIVVLVILLINVAAPALFDILLAMHAIQ
jgi:hypothetical protein